jgi:hypothetical protein
MTSGKNSIAHGALLALLEMKLMFMVCMQLEVGIAVGMTATSRQAKQEFEQALETVSMTKWTGSILSVYNDLKARNYEMSSRAKHAQFTRRSTKA